MATGKLKQTKNENFHRKMAFKCVRDFAEHLKILGYQETIPLSLLNTIHGNTDVFRVYANILLWLIKCLDPENVLPQETRTESDRVLLIKSATEFLAVSSGIKLNPRKLYAATSVTAKELLKVTSALLDSPKEIQPLSEQAKNVDEYFNNDQIETIRKIRGLSTELTNVGVTMFDLISKESVNMNMRNQYSNLPLELFYVEKSLKKSISIMKTQLTNCQTIIENENAEKTNLTLKIQKKTSELERARQRFQALQKIKPAYLDEFERIEQNLKELYGQYIIKVKCLDALRNFVTVVSSPKSVSPMVKVQDSSIAILPEEGLTDSNDEEEEGEGNDSDEMNFKDDSDIFKQVSNRLKTRNDNILLDGNKIGNKNLKSDDLTISETSPESEELESELDFIMNMEEDDDRVMKFKRENSNNNRLSKAEMSDEDF